MKERGLVSPEDPVRDDLEPLLLTPPVTPGKERKLESDQDFLEPAVEPNLTTPSATPAKKRKLIKDIDASTRGGPIEGRLKIKGEMKTWPTPTGQGKLFSFIVADNTDEINVLVCDELADKWYEALQAGKCYRISNYATRDASEQYSKTRHKFELLVVKVSRETFSIIASIYTYNSPENRKIYQ